MQEHRRRARVTAAWPVTVRAGARLLHLRTVNLSPHGVKIGLGADVADRLPPVGSPARLRLEPPDAPPLDVEAIVWRADGDGAAFLFIGAPPAETRPAVTSPAG